MSFYFIAIPIPNQLKNQLSYWQSQYKKVLPYKQWTYIDDFHITLKFLGPVNEEKLQILRKSLKQLKNIQKFQLEIGSLHTFGNINNPRVLWVGVEKSPEIVSLHESIESICEVLSFSKDNRSFQPHITLGKKWSGQSESKLISDLKKEMDLVYILNVNEVILYQITPSDLPKYKVIEKFSLSGGDYDRSTNKT